MTRHRGTEAPRHHHRVMLAALLLSAVAPVHARAQTPDPNPIVDRAVAALKNVSTLRADFISIIQDQMIGTRDTGRGEFLQQRPNRFSWRWHKPAGDLIMSDGQTMWFYFPSTTPNQVIRSALGRAGGSPDLLAEFLDHPHERFTIRYVRAEAVGRRAADVLSFTPKAQNTAYRQVLVWIDRQDSLPHQFEIGEASGTQRRFTLDHLRVNGTLPPSSFVFHVPSGARVVDATQQD